MQATDAKFVEAGHARSAKPLTKLDRLSEPGVVITARCGFSYQ